ncbi:MAG TPA: uroporphyrinogen decarboxylase family protein [Opitutaceae bacterium]|nr:uroporphyrinogen decarboxylase family protein [Opitutaceae bacterium]HND61839.1 uroporphyrinogen decarboxylase family protein [Opitutaceae bacterium]
MRSPHPVATRAEVESVLRCGAPRAVPLFLPAIYEHKAWFIGSTPSAISRDANLLTRAILAEFEAIGPDALTVGVDVYNVEAEAVGCTVTFYEGSDSSIPGIKPGNHRFVVGDDLSAAPLPNPLKDGRMPVNIEAARRVRREVGSDYWLRGAVSGPFSLAIGLVGSEALFMACVDEPEWVAQLLDYAGRIIREYAKAYRDAGAELVVFDSQASPDLISPRMYEEMVLPITRDFAEWAARQGIRDVPLIVGGNTTPIAGLLTRTGCNNLLCDFTADFDTWAAASRAAGRSLRRNVPPRMLQQATPDTVYAAAARELARGRDLPGFIMGTAVAPFGTPTENLLAVKRACLDARPVTA